MNRRIAKKIYKSLRRDYENRYSRDQYRRACLRFFQSPLLVTTRQPMSTSGYFPNFGHMIMVSPECLVFEQLRAQYGLHDWIREEGQSRVVFEMRGESKPPEWPENSPFDDF
jgi:hypothetical protein